MARLPDEWVAHLAQGVTLRVGAATPAGQPELHFGHGMWTLPDGRLELMVRSLQGAELLAAIRATGRVAVSAGLPSTSRVLHVNRDGRRFSGDSGLGPESKKLNPLPSGRG